MGAGIMQRRLSVPCNVILVALLLAMHAEATMAQRNSEMIRCPDKSSWLLTSQVCNGQSDCSDGWDESAASCPADFDCAATGRVSCQLSTAPALCIEPRQACDNSPDCPNGGDEEPNFCRSFNCSMGTDDIWYPSRIKCPSGVGCIDPWRECDGARDCADWSDEDKDHCRTANCSATGRVKCPKGERCVDPRQLCDGTEDCPGNSDEAPGFCTSFNCSESSRVACPPAQGQPRQCVWPSKLCDGMPDCPGAADEEAQFCATAECEEGFVKCSPGNRCVMGFYCDGAPDCYLFRSGFWGENQLGSAGEKRIAGKTAQGSGAALHLADSGLGTWLEAGLRNSSDEDPAFCATFACPEGSVKCRDGTRCVWAWNQCDGVKECADGSDEAEDLCATFDCEADGRVRCPGGGRCLPSNCSFCDGTSPPRCPDGSDQAPEQCWRRNATEFCSMFDVPGNGSYLFECPEGEDCFLDPTPYGDPFPWPFGDPGLNSTGANCSGDPWMTECPSGQGCMWREGRCNGVKDCLDGSDEDASLCSSFNCSQNRMETCPGGSFCLWHSMQLCDGQRDCPDGSDEDPQFCDALDCSAMGMVEHPCSAAKCVYPWVLCNGVPECKNGSDEDPAFCAGFNCSATERMLCPGLAAGAPSVCLHPGQMCDGTRNCPGAADEEEQMCAAWECAPGSMRCLETGRLCVMGQPCDGVPDCAFAAAFSPPGNSTDGSGAVGHSPGSPGELGVSSPARGLREAFQARLRRRLQGPGGARGRLLLDSGEWPFAFANSSDEDPQTCGGPSGACPDGQVKCADGTQCIWAQEQCDGAKHCQDGSDEREELCSAFECGATGRIPCPSGHGCLWSSCGICDGSDPPLCRDGSDQAKEHCWRRNATECAGVELQAGGCPEGAKGCEPQPVPIALTGATLPGEVEEVEVVSTMSPRKKRKPKKKRGKWVQRRKGGRWTRGRKGGKDGKGGKKGTGKGVKRGD